MNSVGGGVKRAALYREETEAHRAFKKARIASHEQLFPAAQPVVGRQIAIATDRASTDLLDLVASEGPTARKSGLSSSKARPPRPIPQPSSSSSAINSLAPLRATASGSSDLRALRAPDPPPRTAAPQSANSGSLEALISESAQSKKGPLAKAAKKAPASMQVELVAGRRPINLKPQKGRAGSK